MLLMVMTVESALNVIALRLMVSPEIEADAVIFEYDTSPSVCDQPKSGGTITRRSVIA